MVHDLPHEIPVNATQSIETQKLMTLATILMKNKETQLTSLGGNVQKVS